MNIFMTLLQKEFVGLWRSKKIIWLPIVFMLLAVMQPVTSYFMEDILKMGGGLPEGAVFEMPTPTSGEVMASVLSQLNTIGLLLIVVAVMGTISDERRNGSLILLMVRPVSPLKLVSSKTIANGILLMVSFILGYLFAYYYTVVLFDSVELNHLIQAMLLYCLYIFFIVSSVILCSALWNSNGTIAIVSIIFFSGLSMVSGWLTEALKWSPTNLSTYAVKIVTGVNQTDGLLGCLIVSVICIVALVVAAAVVVKKKGL
ncbi:ABC transporter permease [Bacillus massiliigorillae]|uniref:ABC transporter permease n=1 Tax=Bacillus massiliigorillae TaxID=1243664 RepID=UPI0003A698EE|nr:ABC transporter permease [Bacillus massiliigorillae]